MLDDPDVPITAPVAEQQQHLRTAPTLASDRDTGQTYARLPIATGAALTGCDTLERFHGRATLHARHERRLAQATIDAALDASGLNAGLEGHLRLTLDDAKLHATASLSWLAQQAPTVGHAWDERRHAACRLDLSSPWVRVDARAGGTTSKRDATLRGSVRHPHVEGIASSLRPEYEWVAHCDTGGVDVDAPTTTLVTAWLDDDWAKADLGGLARIVGQAIPHELYDLLDRLTDEVAPANRQRRDPGDRCLADGTPIDTLAGAIIIGPDNFPSAIVAVHRYDELPADARAQADAHLTADPNLATDPATVERARARHWFLTDGRPLHTLRGQTIDD